MAVAVIGLGVMGGGMARQLASRGHTVLAYNRSRARVDALAEHGVSGVTCPREAAEQADSLILMLSDDAATRACTDGPDGLLAGLRPGSLVLQMGTISPDTTLALADEVSARGASFIDGPVMGSANEAASGKLWILAGSDEETLERARPLLDDLAQEVFHAGPVGQGTRLKLANNLLGGHLVAALSETMTLIDAAGIDTGLYQRVLVASNMGTRMLAGKAAQMNAGDFEARFSVANERKDIGLALALADSLGLSLPHGTSVKEPFDKAMEQGLGQNDVAAIRLVYPQK